MVIFNSYVKLPEGSLDLRCCRGFLAFDIILTMRNPLRLGIPNKQIQALEPQDALKKTLLLLIQRLVLIRGTNCH